MAWSGVTALVLCGLSNTQPLMSEPFRGAWGQDSNCPANWKEWKDQEPEGLAAWVREERMGRGEGEAWGRWSEDVGTVFKHSSVPVGWNLEHSISLACHMQHL